VAAEDDVQEPALLELSYRIGPGGEVVVDLISPRPSLVKIMRITVWTAGSPPPGHPARLVLE
jgi:hypothetical protein